MDSDLKNKLDQIDHKLQVMIENSYLAKLDLMFSVLLSLTIFSAGLLLANLSTEMNILLISVEAFFPVLVYTLIGEAYSILKDDVVTRFGFWLVLAIDFLFLPFVFLYALVLTFVPTFVPLLSGYMIFFPTYFIVMFVIVILNKYTDLFLRYLSRFPTRFQNVQESYGRELKKALRPPIYGMVLYVAVSFVMITQLVLVST